MTLSTRVLAPVAICLSALSLGACGGGPPIPTERYVYASANDCIEAGKLSQDQCTKGVELAITEHDGKAAKYLTMLDCEMKEGVDRCERFAERHFRPRLMGFLIVTGKTLAGSPLYADKKKAMILVDAGGTAFDWQRTADVTFSEAAASKARSLGKPEKPRIKG